METNSFICKLLVPMMNDVIDFLTLKTVAVNIIHKNIFFLHCVERCVMCRRTNGQGKGHKSVSKQCQVAVFGSRLYKILTSKITYRRRLLCVIAWI